MDKKIVIELTEEEARFLSRATRQRRWHIDDMLEKWYTGNEERPDAEHVMEKLEAESEALGKIEDNITDKIFSLWREALQDGKKDLFGR